MNSVMAGMASAPERFATTTGETGFRRGERQIHRQNGGGPL
jgi:hypothetical protein